MDPTKEQLEAMLADYVDGNLDGEALSRAEAFLDANPGVRQVMTRLMIDSEAIRSMPRATSPIDLSEDLRGQLERDMLLGDGTPVHRKRRLSTPVLAMAAMLVIGVGVGGLAYQILVNRPEPLIVATNRESAAKRSTAGPDGAVEPAAALDRVARDTDGRDTDAREAADREGSRLRMAEPTEDARSFARGAAAGGGGGAFGGGGGGGAGLSDGGPPAAISVRSAMDQVIPGAAKTVQIAPTPVPADVTSWVAEQAASHQAGVAKDRAVVFVLDVDEVGGSKLAEEAFAFFSAEADAGGSTRVDRAGAVRSNQPVLADSTLGATARFDATGLAEKSKEAVSNAYPPTPIGQAIAATSQPEVLAALSGPIGVVAISVPEAVAARWQAQVETSLGVGKLTAYEVPAFDTRLADAYRAIGLSKTTSDSPTTAATQSATTQSAKDDPAGEAADPLKGKAAELGTDQKADQPVAPPTQQPVQQRAEVQQQLGGFGQQMSQVSGVMVPNGVPLPNGESQVAQGAAQVAAQATPATPEPSPRVNVYVMVRRPAPNVEPASQPSTQPATQPATTSTTTAPTHWPTTAPAERVTP